VGAWIETISDFVLRKAREVAPRVGAWIETVSRLPAVSTYLSRPAWARGLKHLVASRMALRARSRPAWARGLKR